MASSQAMESFNDLDENDKQAWLELFEQQDGSAKEFCQHNNLNYHQFLNWKRSRNPPQEIDFVEIDCPAPVKQEPGPAVLAELDLGPGITLRIYQPQPVQP